MTVSVAEHVARRGPAARRSATIAGRLAAVFLTAAAAATLSWPSPRYQRDPVGFARDILGVKPWSAQIEILEALRDGHRVAVSSGHKCGKSNTGAIAALWFFASFEDARVVMTAPTSRQVDQILYREVRKLHRGSGICVACRAENARRRDAGEPEVGIPCRHSARLDGEPRELARSGIKTDDFRELFGFTAKEAEAAAGTSGKNIMYIVDEASGVDRDIFVAIQGNRAGGRAKLLLTSNPTQTDGVFFEAFERPELWRTFTVSSESTPNVTGIGDPIPGLANPEWIEECRLEWGEESPLYKVRVKGEFVRNEEGKIVSLHLLEQAEQRWADTPASGPLRVGVDPAGPGDAGDETVFAARRGMRQTAIEAKRGLEATRVVEELLVFLAAHRVPRETPAVIVDREGPIGAQVYGLLRAHLDDHEGDYHLVGVRASERASREPNVYDRIRDELWANGARWLREGGALLSDAKQTKEIHAPSWVQQVNGRLKVTPKDELRKALERSPDRADAWLLSCWEPMHLAPEHDAPAHVVAKSHALDPYDDEGEPERAVNRVFDPYGGRS